MAQPQNNIHKQTRENPGNRNEIKIKMKQSLECQTYLRQNLPHHHDNLHRSQGKRLLEIFQRPEVQTPRVTRFVPPRRLHDRHKSDHHQSREDGNGNEQRPGYG